MTCEDGFVPLCVCAYVRAMSVHTCMCVWVYLCIHSVAVLVKF